jgi:hypothetical protein
MYNNLKYLFISSLVFMACSEEVTEEASIEEPLSAGTADFTKFVAVGNSLTAGFSDGALFMKGQENAYPNMMAKEFAKVGGGTFKTPFMSDNLGGFQAGGAQVAALPTRLFLNGSSPANVPGLSSTILGQSIAASGPYQNMGIPGAKSFHLGFNGYGALNPYYGRIATSATSNVLQDAVSQNPTFFSLWIGNNDVLAYATSGGVGVNQLGNPNPATYGNNDITDPTAFAGVYNQLINALTANGAKGVVANIPSVTSVPYFTTVPHNPVPLDAATAGALNAGLIGPLDQILTALGQPNRLQPLVAGNNNPLLIVDEALSPLGAQISAIAAASGNAQLIALAPFLGQVYGQARHATAADLVCLPTRGVIGQPAGSPVASLNAFGVSYPLQDQHVLVPVEQQMVATATAAFNLSIKAAADSKGLAFFDANAIMNQISTTGVVHQGFRFTGAYVFGNSFSLDGVHLSPRANGFVANLMLEAINAKYGSNFKPIRITNLQALYGLIL